MSLMSIFFVFLGLKIFYQNHIKTASLFDRFHFHFKFKVKSSILKVEMGVATV